jgi:hypothetical protein
MSLIKTDPICTIRVEYRGVILGIENATSFPIILDPWDVLFFSIIIIDPWGVSLPWIVGNRWAKELIILTINVETLVGSAFGLLLEGAPE